MFLKTSHKNIMENNDEKYNALLMVAKKQIFSNSYLLRLTLYDYFSYSRVIKKKAMKGTCYDNISII